VIAPDGEVTRFRPKVKPDAPEVIAAIERGLSRAKAPSRSETSAKN
jgi:glutathione peroxidase